MQQYDSNFYEGKIDLYGASRKSTSQIDKACSQYIAIHPEVLKKFPVLQMGFNLDGTKKIYYNCWQKDRNLLMMENQLMQ